jgi:hypothetical protein
MFECLEDGVGPDDYIEAGEAGKLEVHSEVIGWLHIEAEYFTHLYSGETYRIIK